MYEQACRVCSSFFIYSGVYIIVAVPQHKLRLMNLQKKRSLYHSSRPASTEATAETTAVDQPLLQAYRPARGCGAVRSCASVIPVSLCTGEAFRPREWSLSPLAFCPNVFPSVEPTTIVNVCIQFAGFEQNWHFEEIYCFCCFHIKPFFLPNDISSTPSVRPDYSS